MEPFMVLDGSPTQQPIPEGWVLHPVGEWHGRAATLAYDPRSHQVLFAPGLTVDRLVPSDAQEDVVDALGAAKWKLHSFDLSGRGSIWVRDRRDIVRDDQELGRADVSREPMRLGL